MSSYGLNHLVNGGIVREVPKSETPTEIVCEACCKCKQVKVQHKQLSECELQRFLN